MGKNVRICHILCVKHSMYKVFDNFYLLSEVITAQEAIGSVPNLGWFPLGSFSKITMAFSIHKKYKVVQKKSGK